MASLEPCGVETMGQVRMMARDVLRLEDFQEV
jgi:hypothetical protein